MIHRLVTPIPACQTVPRMSVRNITPFSGGTPTSHKLAYLFLNSIEHGILNSTPGVSQFKTPQTVALHATHLPQSILQLLDVFVDLSHLTSTTPVSVHLR